MNYIDLVARFKQNAELTLCKKYTFTPLERKGGVIKNH